MNIMIFYVKRKKNQIYLCFLKLIYIFIKHGPRPNYRAIKVKSDPMYRMSVAWFHWVQGMEGSGENNRQVAVDCRLAEQGSSLTHAFRASKPFLVASKRSRDGLSPSPPSSSSK